MKYLNNKNNFIKINSYVDNAWVKIVVKKKNQ